jgi:hypothetical protein
VSFRAMLRASFAAQIVGRTANLAERRITKFSQAAVRRRAYWQQGAAMGAAIGAPIMGEPTVVMPAHGSQH